MDARELFLPAKLQSKSNTTSCVFGAILLQRGEAAKKAGAGWPTRKAQQNRGHSFLRHFEILSRRGQPAPFFLSPSPPPPPTSPHLFKHVSHPWPLVSARLLESRPRTPRVEVEKTRRSFLTSSAPPPRSVVLEPGKTYSQTTTPAIQITNISVRVLPSFSRPESVLTAPSTFFSLCARSVRSRGHWQRPLGRHPQVPRVRAGV